MYERVSEAFKNRAGHGTSLSLCETTLNTSGRMTFLVSACQVSVKPLSSTLKDPQISKTTP